MSAARADDRRGTVTDGAPGGGKTVYRPSPLQGLKRGAGPSPTTTPPERWDGADPTLPADAAIPAGLDIDDVPPPATPPLVRNAMLAKAARLLALAAGMRTGRLRTSIQRFHREATQAIADVDKAIEPFYPEPVRQRAKYALCATVDDIAENLPSLGDDAGEWARRSLVRQFLGEEIGDDRFWQLVDEMLATPADNRDLIELYHACLAAGFMGRYRKTSDGRDRLAEIAARLAGALDQAGGVSMVEISPHWRGETAPVGKVGSVAYAGLAAAAAAGFLLIVYIGLRLMLMASGEAAATTLAGLDPGAPLRLARGAAPLARAPLSEQAETLKAFLAREIDEGGVVIEEDARTVRVRTTANPLFASGSDTLEPGRADFFARIGKAIQNQPGPVRVEGHADSDRIVSLSFPDNIALSQARADQAAAIVRQQLTDPARVTSKGMGDTMPIASNATAAGKARNRRVEIVVPRRF